MLPDVFASSLIFAPILIAVLITLGLAWLGMRLAYRIHLIDIPGKASHKLHSRPTPMAGGLTLVAAALVGVSLFEIYQDPVIQAVCLASLPVFVFGLWDDYKGLPPLMKLTGQLSGAILLILLGVDVRIFESPQFFIYGQGLLFQSLDWALTLLWVVGITNAFNFVDSMDGLAVGLGATAAAFFALVTLEARQAQLTQFSALILGACIGLYFFNAPPAMLFLGDSGAQTLGFVFAGLAIGYLPPNVNQASSWFAPILLLWLPIFDTILVIFSRWRRKQPIYRAGLDHTYHRLLRLGLAPERAVLSMQIAAMVMSCLAFVGLHQPPFLANAIFGSVFILSGILLLFMEQIKLSS